MPPERHFLTIMREKTRVGNRETVNINGEAGERARARMRDRVRERGKELESARSGLRRHRVAGRREGGQGGA